MYPIYRGKITRWSVALTAVKGTPLQLSVYQVNASDMPLAANCSDVIERVIVKSGYQEIDQVAT